MLDHFFPLLLPKDSESLKNIGHPTSGSGGKKTVKRYLKSEQTDKQKDKHTDRRTFRLIESIGPEGRCFENGYPPKKTQIYVQIKISCPLCSTETVKLAFSKNLVCKLWSRPTKMPFRALIFCPVQMQTGIVQYHTDYIQSHTNFVHYCICSWKMLLKCILIHFFTFGFLQMSHCTAQSVFWYTLKETVLK